MPPVGFCGELMMIRRVRGVIRLSSSLTSRRKSFCSRSGMGTALPPMKLIMDS